MRWSVGLPTPRARPVLDSVLADARRDRRTPESDLRYRLLSRAVLPALRVPERIRSGDSAAVDAALEWLELDPFCLYSGYAKQSLLRALVVSKLSARQAARVRRVLLEAIVRGPRMEFRDACRLARSVDSVGLRQRLLELAGSADSGTAQRAAWMLERLDAR